MKHYAARLAGLALCVLAGCSGGGGGTAGSLSLGGPTASPHPTPTPQASPEPYSVHRVVGLSNHQMTEIVAGGGNAFVPPGGTDQGTLPGAMIVYPDGSVQIADGNGGFAPSQSTYAQRYQQLLQTSPQAQPLVIAVDPSSAFAPSNAIVQAFSTATIPLASRRHAMRRVSPRDTGTGLNLAGVSLLPATASVFSTDVVELSGIGSDVANNIADISQTNLNFTSSAGAQIVVEPGTSTAFYVPPQPPPGGSITDTVTLTVSVPGAASVSFTASNRIVTLDAGLATAVSGTITDANNNPLPFALGLFAQAGLPHVFAPNYWLAPADANGNFNANLPSNSKFSIALGVTATSSPTGAYGLFVGTLQSGSSTYISPGSNSDSFNLILPSPATNFTDIPPELQAAALPPFVAQIRNAWYATVDAVSQRVFEADSGIQPLLAAVPATFPSPSTPAAIASGQFAGWCYQWEMLNGQPTLAVVENHDATCTSPGNDGFTVTPQGAGQFQYFRFASNTVYSIASPLDVVSNSYLIEGGTWAQTATTSGGQIQSDSATVTTGIYDAGNQTFGAPLYSETLQYTYSLSGGLASIQFSADTLTSPDTGNPYSVLSFTKTQTQPLGASGCQNGSATQCYSINGSITNYFYSSDGNYTQTYSTSGALNGDGSESLTYASQNPGDNTQVVIPVAANASQIGGACLVCGPQGGPGAGTVFDVDGVTPIATFTVTNARLVSVAILDTSPGSPTYGQQIDSLGFIL